MINGEKEIWIATTVKRNTGRVIIAFSNRGRIMKHNGTIEWSTLKQTIEHSTTRVYNLIAKYFIPKTEDDIIKGRNYIDHITHNPIGMNINDVRNLRWCTQKENCNFPEAIQNKTGSSLSRSPRTEFGRKYREHYGYGAIANINQYEAARKYYHKHNKCPWE